MNQFKIEKRKNDEDSQEIHSNLQVFSGQVMFKEERSEKEKAERKIWKEIFQKGREEIDLEAFDFQMGGKDPSGGKKEKDED